jgi:hypothetical protein
MLDTLKRKNNMNIWGEISHTIDAFTSDGLDCNPSYARTTKDVINLIDFYWISKYRDGDMDSTGYKKAFYNIVLNPTEIAAKMIDFDTKDIKIIAENDQDYYTAWIMSRDLKIWMKTVKNRDGKVFGQLLNEFTYNFPKYGHLIVKKAKNSVYRVPLENLYFQQDAKRILDSDLVVEKHDMSFAELRKQPWDKKAIETAIEKYSDENRKVPVFELQGDCECSKDYNYFIIPQNASNEDILYYGNMDRDNLYKEVKWDEISGRALGRGQVERLFEAQIAKNQNENILRSGYRWTSKHIYQTRDTTVSKNLVNEIDDGDVMQINSEITPIAVEERNLGALREGDTKWDRNIQDLTFSYNQLSGERPPAGTPLGTSILQTQMATQFYDLKREDLGMFLKEILDDWVIPDFQKNRSAKHNIMLDEFSADELRKLRKMNITYKLNKIVVNYFLKKNDFPDQQQMETLKALAIGTVKGEKSLIIPKNVYKDIAYKIDIILTNEQIDVASRMTTLQTMLQILGSNPTVMTDPRTKKVFYALIDLAGFSPTDFEIEEEEIGLESMIQQPKLGGSIARPINPIITPTPAIATQTL